MQKLLVFIGKEFLESEYQERIHEPEATVKHSKAVD